MSTCYDCGKNECDCYLELRDLRAEIARLRSDLNQATAVVEAAVKWYLHSGTANTANLLAAIDEYRAAPTGGVEG